MIVIVQVQLSKRLGGIRQSPNSKSIIQKLGVIRKESGFQVGVSLIQLFKKVIPNLWIKLFNLFWWISVNYLPQVWIHGKLPEFFDNQEKTGSQEEVQRICSCKQAVRWDYICESKPNQKCSSKILSFVGKQQNMYEWVSRVGNGIL